MPSASLISYCISINVSGALQTPVSTQFQCIIICESNVKEIKLLIKGKAACDYGSVHVTSNDFI